MFHDSFWSNIIVRAISPKNISSDSSFHYTTGEIADIINKAIQMLQDITDYYNGKNKDSFAKVLSITTISKHRIKKSINTLDSIGKNTVIQWNNG